MVTIAPTNERLETPPDAATKLERQLLQARVWEPAAQSMIEQIGVGREWKCADLGCGPAGVLRPLARAAGAGGIVMGIDNDAAMIETRSEERRVGRECGGGWSS